MILQNNIWILAGLDIWYSSSFGVMWVCSTFGKRILLLKEESTGRPERTYLFVKQSVKYTAPCMTTVGSHYFNALSHAASSRPQKYTLVGGTVVAAPPPFRPGNPALCGSRPLVTPYYCRLGDLLCFVFMSAYCMFDLSVYYLFLQCFDTVGWVFTCKNRLPYHLYCVGRDIKH